MQLDNQQFLSGIYIVFGKHESIANIMPCGMSGRQTLNLARPDAHKVPVYFEKEKLQWIPGIISSHSEHPNQLFSSTAHLLQKTDCLIIGTSGLSNASVIEIINYFTKNLSFGKWLFFINPTTNHSTNNAFVQATEHNIKNIGALLDSTTLSKD